MSTTIDERVVEMRFDNKHFESNVATSMSTLEKLKQKLNLSGATKGLENIDSASKKVNMPGLGSAVETVSTKFSALQVMGVTALANITNSAVNAGKKIASALTIDPIKTGFSEYETQINAVQTILANTSSKGTTLQQVNSALDTLNKYADKTIYNFTEMTRNIGTFTAAGVDLDTSVSAIQGIANLAAVSGSTSQQASTAMYQLSQALSSGTVKLMDWNSVVNAGMGGQVFQDALKQTARVHGVAIDDMIEKQGSFRETLSEGWLTSEILTETLNQFTMAAEEGTAEWEAYKKSLMDTGYTEEQAVSILKMANTATDAATKVKTFTQLWDTLKESAQSGWTESWEIMIGDFEEAKGFLTDVSNRLGSMIGESAEARNKVLTEGLSSGWKQLLGAGIADEAGYKEIFKSVAKEHGTSIDDMIAAEKKLDDSLTDTEAFQKALKTGFKDGSISADMLTESVHKMADKMSNMSAEELKAAGYTQDHVKQIKELSADLKDGTISMDDFVNKMMKTSGRENIIQALWNAFDGLMSVIKPIKEAFREIFPPITGEQVYTLTERIRDLTAKFKLSEEQAAKLKSAFKGIFSVFAMGFDVCKALATGALDLLRNFTGFAGKVLDASASIGDFLSNLRNSAKETNFFGSIVDKVVGFLTNAITKIKEFGQSLKVGLNSPDFNSTLGFFKGLWSIIAKVGSAITKTFGSIGSTISEVLGKGDIFEVLNSGLIAGILLGINKFTSGLKDAVDNVGGFMENVTGILDEVRGCFEAYQQQLKAGALLKIAAAIAILAAALFVISTIDSDKLGTAIIAIGSLFAMLTAAMKQLTKLGASSLFSADSSNPLRAIVDNLQMNVRLDGISNQLLKLSVAILILAGAMKILSGIDWKGIAKGVVGIAALAGILLAAAKIMESDNKAITKFAGQMILMSVAIGALSLVAKLFATMSWEELAKGGSGVLGAVVLLVAAAKVMDSKDAVITKFAGQMILMSVAIGALSLVAKLFATMSWEELAKGGVGLLGAVVLLVQAAKTMDKQGTYITKFAGQMFLMSIAIGVLAAVAKLFATMSWEELAKGGVGILGIVTILVAAAKIMDSEYAVITKFAGQMILMSVGIAILSAAMKNVSSMSWSGVAKSLIVLAGAFAIIGVAGLLLQPLITPILLLSAAFVLLGVGMLGIGAGLTLVAAGISALAVALSAGATSIVAALTVIVTGILQLVPTIARIIGEGIVELAKVIGEYTPQLADSFLKLLLGVLQSLAENAPQITDALFELLIGVINSLATHTPALIEALANLFANVFVGLVDALKSMGLNSIRDGLDIALGLSALMLAMSVALKVAGSISIGSAIKGVLALTAMTIPLVAFVGVLALASGVDNATNNVLALTVLAGACALMLLPLTLVGAFIGPALLGVVALTAMVVPMLAFVGILALMNCVDNAMTNATLLGTFMSIMADVLVKVAIVAPLAVLGVAAMSGLTLLMGAIGVMAVAIGALMDKFPSIQKFLDTGLPVLEQLAGSIGTMIGKFIGGIGEGLSDSLVKMGEDIAAFMDQLAIASDNASGIKGESFDGVKKLMDVMGDIALTTVGTSIGDVFTLGGTSMEKFQTDGVAFFDAMKAIGEASSGVNIDEESMDSVIGAAQKLADLQSSLEPIGGVVSWFTGRDDLGTFGENIGDFISSITTALSSLDGATFNEEALSSIIAASEDLATLQSSLEPIGGVITWFTGRDDLGTFGLNVGVFIESMKIALSNLDGVEFNTEAMNSIISATTDLATLQSSLEPIGGVITWFTGRDDLGTFGLNVGVFIESMKTAMSSLDGVTFNEEALNSIVTAATKLGELQSSLEPIGGVVDWFTGRDDLGTFGLNVGVFIESMKIALSNLDGVEFNTEAMNSIISATTDLATLQSSLEPIGGVITWFTGRDDLGTFGLNVGVFIESMKTALATLDGVTLNEEALTSVITAAEKLAGFQDTLEPMGGVISWFSGRTDLGTFGTNVGLFADAMGKLKSGMGENGISEEVIASITNAGTAIIELQKALPEEGWFDGKMNLTEFSDYVTDFANAMSTFGTKAAEIDSGAVSTVINIAYRIKSLIESLVDIDTSGVEAFTGVGTGGVGADGPAYDIAKAIAKFSDKVADIDTEAVTVAVRAARNLKTLIAGLVGLDTSGIENFKPGTIGDQMKTYSDKVAGIDTGTVSSSISAANRLKNFIAGLVDLDTSGVSKFNPGRIGTALATYSTKIASFDIGTVNSSISAANRLKNFISSLAGLDSSGVSGFKDAVESLAEINLAGIQEAFDSAATQMAEAGSNIMDAIIRGMKGKTPTVIAACTSLVSNMQKIVVAKVVVFNTAGLMMMAYLSKGIAAGRPAVISATTSSLSAAASATRVYYYSFYSAGSYLVSGFANGISANAYKAVAKARVMAQAAATAAKNALDINSPSKVFKKIGASVPEGFAMGIDMLSGMVEKSSVNMANTALDGTKAAIQHVSDMMSTDADYQPTITPVLDLSNVESGAGSIASMFNSSPSIGVTRNVRAVSALMNENSQNGTSEEIVSAINRLRKDLGNVGNTTYSINGVTYDDGSNIHDAISAVVRQARIGRRV